MCCFLRVFDYLHRLAIRRWPYRQNVFSGCSGKYAKCQAAVSQLETQDVRQRCPSRMMLNAEFHSFPELRTAVLAK